MKSYDKEGHLIGIHLHSYVEAELWKYRKKGADVGFERVSHKEPSGWNFYADTEDGRTYIFGIGYESADNKFDDNFFEIESVIADAVQKIRKEEI